MAFMFGLGWIYTAIYTASGVYWTWRKSRFAAVFVFRARSQGIFRLAVAKARVRVLPRFSRFECTRATGWLQMGSHTMGSHTRTILCASPASCSLRSSVSTLTLHGWVTCILRDAWAISWLLFCWSLKIPSEVRVQILCQHSYGPRIWPCCGTGYSIQRLGIAVCWSSSSGY